MRQNLLDFILKYQEDVARYCYFLCRNEIEAKDLAQETFIKALVVDSEIQNPKAFLFQIAKNLFLDEKRKQKYRQSLDQLNQAELAQSSIDPPDLEVWQILFRLESGDQEVLVLVDREGMSISEAAKSLRLSEAALKSRLFRARENFKKFWNE